MITYEKVDFNNEVDEALKAEILDFEYNHIIDTLRALDMEYDEIKRRKYFKEDEIAIICRNEKRDIVGSLEYGTGVNLSEDEVYVTALFIMPKYKGNKFLLNLLGYMIKDLRERPINYLACNVHKSNAKAIHLYKRLGFQFHDIEGNDKQFRLKMSKEILYSQQATKIYDYYIEQQPFT